jgi:hypothetical protein
MPATSQQDGRRGPKYQFLGVLLQVEVIRLLPHCHHSAGNQLLTQWSKALLIEIAFGLGIYCAATEHESL